MKQKTRILIYILIAIAIVIVGIIAILSGRTANLASESHLDLGHIYLADLSYDKAILEFNEAIKIDPKDPEPYIELANAYIEIDDIPSAIETLETGLKETDDDEIEDMLEELKKSSGEIPGNESESDVTSVPPETSISIEAASEAGTTVSTVNMVEVPNLSGLSEEEAKKLCEDNGFKYSVSYAGSNDIEKGFVIGQTIPAGASVAEGISIPFSVSKGSLIKVELAAENLEFDYLANFEESGWAFAVKGSKAGYVNINGQYVEVYNDVHKLDEQGKYGDRYYECNGPCLYLVNGISMKEDDLQSGPDAEYYLNPFKVSAEGLYPYESNEKWGYANINTGKIIIPCQYNEVSYFNCGRGIVKYDDPDYVKQEPKFGEAVVTIDYIPQITKIIDINNNEITIKNNVLCTDYYIGCFANNVAVLKIAEKEGYNERNAVIGINGNIIDDEIQTCPYEIWNTKYSKEAKILTYICDLDFDYTWNTVFIDENGKQICSLNGQYYVIGINKYGYALCMCNRINNNYTAYAIIDYKNGGKIVGQYDVGYYSWYNYEFSNNRISRGRDSEIWALFDFNGNKLLDSEYEFVGNPTYELISVKKNGKFGFIDSKGNLKIDYIFDNVYFFFNDDEKGLSILCENANGTCLIDASGKVLYQFNGTFEYLANFNNENYIVTKNNNKYSIYKILD